MRGEVLLRTFQRAWSCLVTVLVRSSFRSFGRGSRIAAPVRLIGANRIVVGEAVFIGSGTWLNCLPAADATAGPALRIGDGVSLSGNATISAVSEVVIGDHALLARGVYISDHGHRRAGGRVDHDRHDEPAAVRIGEGVWLGQNVCVLPGVSIGAGAVVGANSVVTQDVPAQSVAVGAPARVIRSGVQ